ncbi:MAG: arsenite methyltransferase, partial [bacterium]|nr:arsenite methyltransferase [bacterium]
MRSGVMEKVHDESTVERIREEYSRIAERGGIAEQGECCAGTGSCSPQFGYDSGEIEALPDGADMGLGCGAPVGALELQPGETVLDLGSGGGIDVFLAAGQVGPEGRVIGIDMTPSMLALARKNAGEGGYDNVEFREGRLEALPVDDASIDAVTSNCVINLVPDKQAVYREIARVLRPGGRVIVSDIVVERPLPESLLREMNEANCVVTAILRERYLDVIRDAGLGEPEVLRDIDYLAAAGWGDRESMNEESRALLDRAGVDYEQIRDTVHSITVRAFKK